MTRSLPILAMLAAAALTAACGGGSKPKPTKVHHSSKPPAAHHAPTVLTESVLALHVKGFTSSLSVKPGDPVSFRTFVPASLGAVTVTVKLQVGPSDNLVVEATSKGETSQVTLKSANHKPLTLAKVHYKCALPPAPTFCPAVETKAEARADTLKFATSHAAGVLISAVVGPVPIKLPRAVHVLPVVVPPYVPTELLVVHPRTPSAGSPKVSTKPPRPAPAMAVKPGDSVTMLTALGGRPVGAPQTIRITVNQGPAKSIKVSGSVAGGSTSSATIRSANGSPIALVLPTFTCFVAPIRTFCPALKTKEGSHEYTLTFLASPRTAVIGVSATVQGS